MEIEPCDLQTGTCDVVRLAARLSAVVPTAECDASNVDTPGTLTKGVDTNSHRARSARLAGASQGLIKLA
jgi:hypothetical protein